MAKCERCDGDARCSIMSTFNTEQICMECEGIEAAHPAWRDAKRLELSQTDRGNYNFEGAGLPADLRECAEIRKRKRNDRRTRHAP